MYSCLCISGIYFENLHQFSILLHTYTTLQKVSGQALFDFLKIEYINYHFLKKKPIPLILKIKMDVFLLCYNACTGFGD